MSFTWYLTTRDGPEVGLIATVIPPADQGFIASPGGREESKVADQTHLRPSALVPTVVLWQGYAMSKIIFTI
ncbi:hypothetical protein ACX0G7_10880 [Flavitalea antarctica]